MTLSDASASWKRMAPMLYRHRRPLVLLYAGYVALVVWQSLEKREWAHFNKPDAAIGQSSPAAFWTMTTLACMLPLLVAFPTRCMVAAMATLAALLFLLLFAG